LYISFNATQPVHNGTSLLCNMWHKHLPISLNATQPVHNGTSLLCNMWHKHLHISFNAKQPEHNGTALLCNMWQTCGACVHEMCILTHIKLKYPLVDTEHSECINM